MTSAWSQKHFLYTNVYINYFLIITIFLLHVNIYIVLHLLVLH